MRAPRSDSDEPLVEMLSGKGLRSQRSEIQRVGEEWEGVDSSSDAFGRFEEAEGGRAERAVDVEEGTGRAEARTDDEGFSSSLSRLFEASWGDGRGKRR